MTDKEKAFTDEYIRLQFERNGIGGKAEARTEGLVEGVQPQEAQEAGNEMRPDATNTENTPQGGTSVTEDVVGEATTEAEPSGSTAMSGAERSRVFDNLTGEDAEGGVPLNPGEAEQAIAAYEADPARWERELSEHPDADEWSSSAVAVASLVREMRSAGQAVAEANHIVDGNKMVAANADAAVAENTATDATNVPTATTDQNAPSTDAETAPMLTAGTQPNEPTAAETETALPATADNTETKTALPAVAAKPQPVGHGAFGDIYDQFKGKAKEAINFLKKLGSGEAVGALNHKEIGDISLVWGNEKAGLKKILHKHPDVADNLQSLLNDMHVTQSSDNRIVLESDTHKAVVSKMLGKEKTPQWLLTAYEKKKKVSGGSRDIVPEPGKGKQNGTAPLQDTSSTSKDTTPAAEKQEPSTEKIQGHAVSVGDDGVIRVSLGDWTDAQGNPLNADGTLKLEKVRSVDEITDADFSAPTRSIELPTLPGKVDAAIGADGKPVVIKKNILVRNSERHPDITAGQSRDILKAALYSPDLYGQNQKAKRPYNWVVINTKGEDGKNRLVLLEISPSKDSIEIVHWHYVDERGLAKIKRQAESEDGQLLILPSEKSEEVGALSDPTLGLSSEGKGSEKISDEKDEVSAKAADGGKIGDFGEKIGSARKDLARQRIVEAKKLTSTDLKKIKDPDKMLSRKQIIKYAQTGEVTNEQASQLLAANMAARTLNDGMEFYRNIVVRWNDDGTIEVPRPSDEELREKKIASMTGAERAFFLADELKTISVSRMPERLFEQAYNAYAETYKAIDYPATDRKIGGAVIRHHGFDGRYWVKSKYDARRGWPCASMPEAVAKFKSLYPEVEKSATDKKKQKGGTAKGEDHMLVVENKDWQGGYTIKSRVLPGNIYLVGTSFPSRKAAEKYLDENREALANRERRLVDALVGTNIGSAERKGKDWRGGKDVTPKDFLDKFGFRGVEFGNWVTQSERGEYLNKTYDAIMDFCELVGISPRAFSLNGRLGLAFGARGHGKAMAHYEPGREVINLTRTKGVGSLAHEWFHALDNYLARSKSGNVSDFATETHDTLRAETGEAFKDFVVAMSRLDYVRRSMRAGDYWGRKIECAARLFQCYIYNKATESGIVSPLLSRRDLLAGEDEVSSGNAYPLPSPEENAQMKPYLDAIFDTVQERVDEETGNVIMYHRGNVVTNTSPAEAALRDAVVDRLREGGLDVITDEAEGQRVLDMANEGVYESRKKKSAPETAELTPEREAYTTAVSSADGAKILNNIDSLASKYEEKSSSPKTFIGDLAKALNIPDRGTSSKYATFETKGGKVVTFRISNHNATVRNFDNENESDGISIVVSGTANNGITNNGNAHVVEYFYSEKELRRAEGKPLADIVRSIKQALYSGEFTDTTGLAERQEVNADDVARHQVRFFRTPDGEAYGFTVGGKIYVDPRIAKADTPLHEYSHLWAAAVRKNNPKEWKNVVELMHGTGIWDEVKKRYPELDNDDDIAEEVLAHYSGSRGAERLRAEQQRIVEGDGTVLETAAALSALERVKDALRRFWKGVADFLHIHFTTAEEVADRVLRDLLNGVDPRKYVKSAADDAVRYRKRIFGGNNGYVGYSMSKRAARAREDGRFPKSDFKRYYGMTDSHFKALADAGILNDSEWHHTSMYGNETTFYRWEEPEYEDVYDEHKDEIGKIVKDKNARLRKLKAELGYSKEMENGQNPYEDNADKKEEHSAWERKRLDIQSQYYAAAKPIEKECSDAVVGVFEKYAEDVRIRQAENARREQSYDDYREAAYKKAESELYPFTASNGVIIERDGRVHHPKFERVFGRFERAAYEELGTAKRRIHAEVDKTILSPEEFFANAEKGREAGGYVALLRKNGGGAVEPSREVRIVEAAAEHGFANYAAAKRWAKENIARTYGNDETGGKGEIRISNKAIEKYLSQSAVDKSESKDVHLSVLKVLPNVIREGVDAEQHPDYRKDEKGVRSTENGINPNVTIHRLYGAVRIGDKMYRVKVTLKEDSTSKEPKVPHSYEATKIELFAGTLENSENSLFPNTNNSISAAKLLNGVEKSYGNGEKLIGDFELLPKSERRAAVQREVDAVDAELGTRTVVKDTAELDDAMRRAVERDGGCAYYDPATGETVVLADKALGAADVRASVVHENIGHKSVDELLGDKAADFYREAAEHIADPEELDALRSSLSVEMYWQLKIQNYATGWRVGWGMCGGY